LSAALEVDVAFVDVETGLAFDFVLEVDFSIQN
jgi:hypothetical protein